jgi:phosphoglycerol transferase MdoB-like AlkP superfamily enzyme
MKKLPGRLLPALLIAAVFFAVSLGTRVLLSFAADTGTGASAGAWVRVYATGLLYDLVAALYVAGPVGLWLAVVPDRIARSTVHRMIAVAAFAAFVFAALLLPIAEWLFWEEFGSRFNFIAVDYLLYTHEVLGNIRESYPVGRILAGLALVAAVIAWPLRKAVWRSSGAPFGWRTRVATVALLGIATALSLRWLDSDVKSFSDRDALNELAGNGLYEFFAANYRNELSYGRHYATVPTEEALALVQKALQASGEGVERHIVHDRPERRLNVVLVSVESLGAEFLGRYGDRRGLTPNLDRLAGESLWFSKLYATGNRTVRGMEALSLALPPTPGQSIVRRPKNEVLFSLGSVFEDKGYSVIFAYGGYGYFDNMNAFFDANDYRAVDRRSIPSQRVEFENVWGVADEHLYDHVIAEMDREYAASPRQPVFVHVMTTSNHRPYTYPPGRVDIPSGSGREGAVKYTDYALGRFIESARTRPWFDDTVFVLTADHGANARGTSRIPVDKYLIPLMVYSPAHVKPRRIDRLMSQIDVPPTILGLLDFDYYSKFFGRDMLKAPSDSDRAFVANYQTLGYLKGDRMVLLAPKRKVEVFQVDHHFNILRPVEDEQAVREAISYYQAASHVFRSGLYRDEEQIAPDKRAARTRAPGAS